MKVKVGIIGANGAIPNVTATLHLERFSKDTENMHTGNYEKVALAVARRRLNCEVFPIEIDRPVWLTVANQKAGA